MRPENQRPQALRRSAWGQVKGIEVVTELRPPADDETTGITAYYTTPRWGVAIQPMVLDAWSADLATRAQWVCYRLLPDPKPDDPEHKKKMPYTPATMEPAKAGQPKTWGSFQEAMARMERGECDGIGYELDWDDPYTGVDLDKCRDAETGEIAEWAREIIAALDSYTELSPSGTGVHIWIRGRIASTYLSEKQQGRKVGPVEIYSGAHYLTMTGQHLDGTPTEIRERQAALDAICAQYLAAKAKTPAKDAAAARPTLSLADEDVVADMCRYNARAAALWNGDTSGYASASNADEALISHLWYWTDGDSDQVERLMRASGLYREKFDRADYLPQSIAAWQRDFPSAARRSDRLAPMEEPASTQADSNKPHLEGIPPGDGDELAIVRALREELRRVREEARQLSIGLENLARERAAEDEILASSANDTDKVMMIALRRGISNEKPDDHGYVSMWLDTTDTETGEKRGWSTKIGKDADAVRKRMQRLASQGAGHWVPGKYDRVTGKSVAPRFKPAPALQEAPVAILYGTATSEDEKNAPVKPRTWGGDRSNIRICQKCRKASGLQVVCQHCLAVQEGQPLLGTKDKEGNIYDPEGVLVETLPGQNKPNKPHLEGTPDVLGEAPDADVIAAPPSSVDISPEYRNLPDSGQPIGRPCMRCGTPLRIFPAGGYYPCPSCSAETAKAVGQ